MILDFDSKTVGVPFILNAPYNPTTIVVDNYKDKKEVVNYRFCNRTLQDANFRSPLSIGRGNIEYK